MWHSLPSAVGKNSEIRTTVYRDEHNSWTFFSAAAVMIGFIQRMKKGYKVG